MEDEITEPTEAENQAPEVQVDETPAPEQEQEQKETQTPAINQEAVEKRINKLTFQKYEEQRKREELEARLRDIEQEKVKAQGDIPPIPDPYDDDFQQKLQRREQAIRRQAEADAVTRAKYEQESQTKQSEIQKSVERMRARAAEYGIDEAELNDADKRVSMFIQNPDLARYIIGHDQSPLIVKHLSNNIGELEKIGGMDPVSAAAYIASNVVPHAEKLKPKITSAPDPLEIPGGKGAGEKVSKFLEGVKLE